VTLDDLLLVANLSKYHFIRVFKRQMGLTPYQYLQQYRMNQAQVLLCGTNMPISEVAVQVGYGDTSGFIEHFCGVVGVTSAVYRKQSYRWI